MEAQAILDRCGAFVTGSHFVLAPKEDAEGKTYFLHARDYVDKDAIYPDTQNLRWIAEGLAEQAPDEEIDVVVGPEKGAILLASWTADSLSCDRGGQTILGIYAEKTGNGAFELLRGYDALVRGKQALVVEDVLTFGKTVRGTIEAVRRAGGSVVGVSAIVNRDPDHVTSASLSVPLRTLLELRLQTWNPESADGCPLCRDRVPYHPVIARKNIAAYEQFLVDRSRGIV